MTFFDGCHGKWGRDKRKLSPKLQITLGVAQFILEHHTVVREMYKRQVIFQGVYINNGIAYL